MEGIITQEKSQEFRDQGEKPHPRYSEVARDPWDNNQNFGWEQIQEEEYFSIECTIIEICLLSI